MLLKQKFGGMSVAPKWLNDNYKNATKSLKPKTFKRTIEKEEGWSNEEVFFMSTLPPKAGFRDVDSFAQQQRYYEYGYIFSLIRFLITLFVALIWKRRKSTSSD
jgi:hypothetical protein